MQGQAIGPVLTVNGNLPGYPALRSSDPMATGLISGVVALLVLSVAGGGIGDYLVAPLMVSSSIMAGSLAHGADAEGFGSGG